MLSGVFKQREHCQLVCEEKHLLGLHSLPCPALLNEPIQREVVQLPEGQTERKESGLPKRLPEIQAIAVALCPYCQRHSAL